MEYDDDGDNYKNHTIFDMKYDDDGNEGGGSHNEIVTRILRVALHHATKKLSSKMDGGAFDDAVGGDNDNDPLSTSFSGVVEATATVLLTTMEDCIWLIPFVAQASTPQVALVHGCIFVFGYLVLALVTCILSVLLQESLAQVLQDNDALFEFAGSILGWVFAGFLYYREWKREQDYIRHNRRPTSVVIPIEVLEFDWSSAQSLEADNNYGSMTPLHPEQLSASAAGEKPGTANSQRNPSQHRVIPSDLTMDYEINSIIDGDGELGGITSNNGCTTTEEDHPLRRKTAKASNVKAKKSSMPRHDSFIMRETDPYVVYYEFAQPLTVLSLTFLGGVDEICYFPALVVGEVFTVSEICMGTFFASILILVMIEYILNRMPQCLVILDHLPVYSVVTIFAFVLTLKAVWTLASDSILAQVQNEAWLNETISMEEDAGPSNMMALTTLLFGVGG